MNDHSAHYRAEPEIVDNNLFPLEWWWNCAPSHDFVAMLAFKYRAFSRFEFLLDYFYSYSFHFLFFILSKCRPKARTAPLASSKRSKD